MKKHFLTVLIIAVLFACLLTVGALADGEDGAVTEEATETVTEVTEVITVDASAYAKIAGKYISGSYDMLNKFVSAVGSVIPGYNYIKIAADQRRIEAELEDSYTPEAAAELIDGILEQYSPDSTVTFGNGNVHITNSYLISSRYDRQKISTIIRNTGLTERTSLNLAAEWKLHNIAYDLNVKRDSTTDADLDYVADPRWYVNAATGILELLRWL